MFYHLPLKHWVRGLFSQPSLAPFLQLEQDNYSHGSVRQSNGYRQKAIDNPVINSDQRNQALIGTADGVPLFGVGNGNRAGTPFMLRTANAPEAVSLKLYNCHLHGFLPNEYFTTNPDYPLKKNPVRDHFSTKNSCGALTVLVDDLLTAYKKGFKVVDQSKPLGDPERVFTCKTVLLYWSVSVLLARVSTC